MSEPISTAAYVFTFKLGTALRNTLFLWLFQALLSMTTPAFSAGKPADDKLESLVFSGPFSAISYPLIHMVETRALSDMVQDIQFIPVNNPDQARLLALGKGAHQTDFMAMPSNVAAMLYNKGIRLKLINVPIWDLLWIVSQDKTRQHLSDLKGEKIAIPYRADMPDILFQQIAKAEGLNPKSDFKLHYTAHPLDAMQLLISGQVKHALLTEPATSMVLHKNRQLADQESVALLYRSVDLQQEWGRVFQRPAKIPQLSITAMQNVLDKPKLLQRFQQEYRKSSKWCLDHPEETGKMVTKYHKRLTPETVAESLKWTVIDVKSAAESKPELEYFYHTLMNSNPALVGNRLPDNDFYYSH